MFNNINKDISRDYIHTPTHSEWYRYRCAHLLHPAEVCCCLRAQEDSDCISLSVVVVVYGHDASATWLLACSGFTQLRECLHGHIESIPVRGWDSRITRYLAGKKSFEVQFLLIAVFLMITKMSVVINKIKNASQFFLYIR